jgi:transposase
MGWTETCAVEERMRFMVAVEKGEESFTAICRRFDVSRRVGYKWLARFEAEGLPACSTVRELRCITRNRSHRALPSAASRCGGHIRPGAR